jgi:hypothetical protein
MSKRPPGSSRVGTKDVFIRRSETRMNDAR